ncbi:rhomboid family intramembrane serine protease [Bacillus sp. MUM 13]|uniref:rhomboid family intramembrane serine protease n=1 Tax=Bacillus sp. MUM 13 TaxID=1678001 RepID=UPI0009F4115A|nr:rhomboid family intramembrane serine protease [Bacillus sp. MUM 13]
MVILAFRKACMAGYLLFTAAKKKVGKVLGFQEDYLFWSAVKNLSSQYNYRVITISDNHQEIWLENSKEKNYPVIRLMLRDLDWASWLKRDIERTVLNGEQIRKKLYHKPLKVLNIYITSHVPVDDYDFADKPFVHRKTEAETFILNTDSFGDRWRQLEELTGMHLDIVESKMAAAEEDDISSIKQSALTEAVKKAKEEQMIFERGKPVFTYIFIAIGIAVYFLMEWAGSSTRTDTLIDFGAKYSPLILQGEWWRFFTPMVIHIGMLHLIMNTISLYFIGPAVEKMYGSSRFLFIYLLAGFSGTLGSFLLNPALSAGASGAIFGLFGALLYFGISNPRLFFRTMGLNVFILIIINLGYGFSNEGIDNAAHIGGLIGGFFAAGIVHLPKDKQPFRQILFAAAAAGLIYFLLQYGYEHQESSPENDMAAVQMASDEVKKGNVPEAKKLLEGYVNSYDEAPYSHFMLGNISFGKGNYEAAKKEYLKAAQQNPDMSEAYYNLALSYTKLNQFQEAKKAAGKAVERKPSEASYKKLEENIDHLLDNS